ncbi:hypothetical protein ACS6K7_14350 [Enterobacter chuandaensis]|uniref:hypothetical protein n=1 Tax=Enterobacter chuandaensis TaxID=2497875 RepID=UPI003BDE2EFB
MQVNDEVLRQIVLERERLTTPPQAMSKASGVGIARFVVSCNDAYLVLTLAKDVMTIINNYSTQNWPSLDRWLNILPLQFTHCFLPELSEVEREKQTKDWEALTYEEKLTEASHDEQWTLSSWLSWMEPNEREWFWWDTIIFDMPLNNTHFLIEVTTLDSMFMAGALKKLFKACGAVDVVSEDDL